MKNLQISIKNILTLSSLLLFNLIILILIINSNQLFPQFILLQFLIIGSCFFISKILNFIGKTNISKFFLKLGTSFFVLYIIIFINIWNYDVIKAKEYVMLLFSFPVYILALYFIKMIIVGKNKDVSLLKKIFNKLDFAEICVNIICILCIIGGIIMLSIGVVKIFDYSNEISSYVETKGYFSDYSSYSDNTYTLIYSYYVDNIEYTISTTYGTAMIPKIGNTKMVKYNPNNPEEAVVTGGESYIFMMFMGFLFIIIPIIIMSKDSLYFISNNKNSKLALGLIIIILGLIPLYLITGSFSVIKLISDYPIDYLPQNIIIIFLLVVGACLLIESIIKFIKNK